MDLERWRRVEQIFDTLLDLPAEDREGYLDHVCESDPELRAKVEELVAAWKRAEGRALFEQPAWSGLANLISEVPNHPQEVDDPMIGKVVGDIYTIRKRLGEGGFGDVYLAVGNVAGREAGRFVVKFARHLDADQRRRFDEEIRINAGLKHENIAPIKYWGEFEGRQFLVIEHVDGENLGEFINHHSQPGGGLAPGLVAEITRQACAAIQYAHDRGVIHRDIKPQNIMIEQSGGRLIVKVIDFGLAKSADAITRRPTEGVIGSFNYIAPEQIDQDKFGMPGPLCDVYAMGLVIHEMLTGRIAIAASGVENHALVLKQLNYTPPPPGISGEVDRVVMKAIRKDPGQRQRTVSQLAQELESAIARRDRPAPKPGKWKAAILFGALTLLLFGGGAGWRFMTRDPGQEVKTEHPTPEATPPHTVPLTEPAMTVFVKNDGKGAGQIVGDWNKRVFTSRDMLRLTIDPPGDGYIYLVQRGSLNDLTLLYPDYSIDFASDNAVKAQTPVIFPRATRGEPNWFQFSNPGLDIIYVVFVKDKSARLGRLIEDELRRNRNERNRLEQILLDKGIEAILQQAMNKPIDDLSAVSRIELRHVK